ncbi:MAG: histidine phosphatase family protein [Proteobacteria bacterium]|nr:histidine phosphatase family protein [Pseudomonadota bacterium]
MKLRNTYRPGSKRLQDVPSGQFSNNRPCLFLLRHGQIQGHETRSFIGQTDIALDETGKAQALFWKNALAHIRFGRIYSSALARCRDTADLVCPGKETTIDARLNEINMGTWDGVSFAHIRNTLPDLFDQRGLQMETFRPPGGESFNDLYNRVFPFFESLGKTLEAPTLVVTHAGVIRVMLCRYLGMDPGKLHEIKMGYGHLFVLEKI